MSACELYFAEVFLLKEGNPKASQKPVNLVEVRIRDTGADDTTDVDATILEGEYQVAKGLLFSTAR